MTKIEFTDDGKRIAIKANGHSYFRESNDIVCAALSYLVQSFAWYTGAKYITGDASFYMTIDAPNDKARAVFNYVRDAIGDLADQFPDNVTVLGEK